MVDALKDKYGTKIMVSTWPFSQGDSKTYKPLEEKVGIASGMSIKHW
jgi:hypothetical protein